ncbi:MAG: hypothetical protein ICV66_02195 [Chitinophagaceae bacterium]|nr:hypothetical protein [Chitinophagaceae bacterium]
MKKLLVVFAIAGALTACNNSGTSTENKKDSIDSMAAEKKDAIDSTAEEKKDAVDSAAERKKDALDKKDSANRKDTSRR